MKKQISGTLDDFISVRLSRAEKDLLEAHLESQGKTKSEFIRSKVKRIVRTIKERS